MIDKVSGAMVASTVQTATDSSRARASTDLGLRFEQMFWAEMLSQAGFEDALTKSGGEAAASFSRFLVESIASDLAKHHPLGFAEKINPPDVVE